MAVRRPLKKITGGLQELSDSNLERLTYLTQVAFATYLKNNTNGYGAVYVSNSGDTAIGSMTDTRATVQTASGSGGFSGQSGLDSESPDEGSSGEGPPTSHDTGDYPTAPGVGSEDVTTYYYRQDQNEPSAPSDATYNSDGYLVYSATGELRTENSETNILDTIVTAAVTQMTSSTGDNVGTYRVSASAPSVGGAGTWDYISTWFVDTNYPTTTNTTYKLWLKRNLDSAPGTAAAPVEHYSGGEVRELAMASTDNLFVNVLLPILQRRIVDSLKYEVVSTNVTSRNRGSFTDTQLTGATTSYSPAPPFGTTGPSDTYTTTSTPSGSAGNLTTKHLLIGA